MEAFDTNVIVRLCVRDDEQQYARAESVFRRATAGAGAWLSSVVLVEVAWVLRAGYKFDRATTAATLGRLIAIDGVYVEDDATTHLALAAFRAELAHDLLDEFDDRLRMSAQLGQSSAFVAVVPLIIRPKLNRLLKFHEGLFMSTQFDQSEPFLIVILRVVRPKLNRLIVLSQLPVVHLKEAKEMRLLRVVL